jgi:hypothetical protein
VGSGTSICRNFMTIPRAESYSSASLAPFVQVDSLDQPGQKNRRSR